MKFIVRHSSFSLWPAKLEGRRKTYQITLCMCLYVWPFPPTVPQLYYTNVSICTCWNQIELKVWIAFTCQDSIRQSCIPGATSQFLICTRLRGRSLFNRANRTDFVHKYSLCFLWKLTECHFYCCSHLGDCVFPCRVLEGWRLQRDKRKQRRWDKREESNPWGILFTLLFKNNVPLVSTEIHQYFLKS